MAASSVAFDIHFGHFIAESLTPKRYTFQGKCFGVIIAAMKRFLLAFAAVLGFASQAGSRTQTTLDQITAPNATGVMIDVAGKGWTFAVIDASLVIDATTTPPTLRAPGGGQPTFVDAVTPAGTVDGVNAIFTLPSAPNPSASLELSVNGLTYKAGTDFSLSGATVTFISVPTSGSVLVASYRR